MSADTKSTTRHAICPVHQYRPENWVGWYIRSTERVEHTANVLACGGDKVKRMFSTGKGWDVHHLVQRGVR